MCGALGTVCVQNVRFFSSFYLFSNLTSLSPRLLVHKEKVILFVAHDNVAANKVYDRVGFVGLNKEAGSSPLVRPWLEIGFDRDLVHLGHW